MNHPVELQVSDEEMHHRRNRLWKKARELELDAICLFNPTSIFYLTRFRYLVLERPVCLVMTPSRSVCLVPHLERRHVEQFAFGTEVVTYPEYPGLRHPMLYLGDLFQNLGMVDAKLGLDSPAPPEACGYRGPSVVEILPKASVISIKNLVPQLRMVKSPEEIALMRTSGHWSTLTHRCLQKHTAAGMYENEITLHANLEATMAMVHMYGERDVGFKGIVELCPNLGFRGQIGVHSGIPHSLTRNAVIRKGDVLITQVGANVGGYHTELERTMIVGQPSPKQEEHFNLMVECQDTVLSGIRPGVTCAEIDRISTSFYREHGLMDAWPSHIGHSIGLESHEPPYLDEGEEMELLPGMVFTVEPGMMFEGFAGFRHSDTVLVTDSGFEFLTVYPRDIESLII